MEVGLGDQKISDEWVSWLLLAIMGAKELGGIRIVDAVVC